MSLPFVFLHGFLGTASDWEPLISHLPAIECICIDLPGHGKTPFSKTFDFMPRSPKFHLIGYSMGGRLAMQYAISHPDRVEKLILASTHPGLTSGKEERLKKDAEWAASLRELPIDDFLTLWDAQPLFGGFAPTSMRSQNREELAKALLHYSLAHQPFLHVEKALHVVGEKDFKFRALHPNAVVIGGAGHRVHLEKPKEFAKIIEKHIISSHD